MDDAGPHIVTATPPVDESYAWRRDAKRGQPWCMLAVQQLERVGGGRACEGE